MTVSIITATYNSASTVADTIISVNQQSYPHIEHLIVDGLSKDNTLEIIKNVGHAGKVICEKDDGIYDAMNKGIAYVTGEIIGILNSDDFYPSNDVIEKVVEVFKSTECDAVYGDLLYIDGGDTKKIVRRWVSGGYKKKNFLYGWMPPHPTFFVRKSVYERYGSFNLQLKSAADYELMLRFLYKYSIKASYLGAVLVHMRTGGQSNSSLYNRIKANKEDRLAWSINGLKSNWYTLYLKPIRKISQFFNK
ncbi:glycosyltransferase family 2 protein [Chitinophagaceae bacterium LWZ2-11]